MAEEQTDISILQNIRNEIEKRIDVLTDDVKTLRNISEEKQQDLKQQISSVYQIIEEKLSQIQSIDLNLKDSNQNINDLNARTSSMSDNISSLLQSQNEIKRNIQSLSVDINKIQNDSVNQFNQLNEYTREISKKIAESAKRQERQTREEMVRGPRAAAQASLGITPSAEAKSLQQPEPTQEPESEEKKPKTWTEWFKENAGLLGAAAGAATGVGAGALIGSGPKSAPSGPGYSSPPGEVPSAPPAPNIVGPGVAPGSAPSGPGYSSPPGEVPSALPSPNIVGSGKEFSAGLAKLRQDQFSKELENEGVLRQLAALEKVEVGGMSEKSKMDWLETLFNRAGVTNSSLMSRLTGRNKPYWGGGIGNPNKVTKEQLESFKARTQEILKGRDVTEGATDNASNDYRSGNLLADSRARKLAREGRSSEGRWTGGAKDKGEYVYTDSHYVKRSRRYRERMRELDEKLGKSAQSQREPQETAPQPDASRVPPQSQQSQQPDARREDGTVPSMAVKQMQGIKAGHRKNPLDEDLVTKLNYAANKTGVEIEVFSGSQTGPGASRPPGASHEHNDGKAADFELYITDKDGKRRLLNYDNPEDAVIMDKFTEEAARAGVRSAGVDYMGKTKERRSSRIHMGTSRRNPDAYLGRDRFKSSWHRGRRDFLKHGAPKDLENYSTEAIRRRLKEQQEQQEQREQPEQQEQTQQQLFAGDTSESVIAKAIKEEQEKDRISGLTERQNADESKRRNYYNVKELKEGRSQLTPEQQKKFDKMRIRGPFQTRQSAYLKSILGPNWLKKSQQPDQPPDDSGSVLDYLPYIPAPTDFLPDAGKLLGSALKSFGSILFPSAEAAELKKPVDKSKIDMSDMPGSLDDGGEEGPRTDNRWNPLSPVTYGKPEEKIREMIELAKKAAEAAEIAAKTSPGNSGKGPTAPGENNSQPPPATPPSTPSGGNQNGNNTPPKGSAGNGLDSRPVPSSADRYAPALNDVT